MACSHSNMIGVPLSPTCGGKDLIKPPVTKVSTKTRVLLPLQVRSNAEQKLQKLETSCISRRDTMLYMTAEILSGVALLSAEPAKARGQKLERKRKIMEKLREKAGVPKTEIENEKLTLPAPKPPTNPQQGSTSGGRNPPL